MVPGSLLELESRQALAGWPKVIMILHTGGVCKDQVASVLNEVGVICYIALTDQARILVLRHKLPPAKIGEDLNALRACGQKLP